MLSSVQNAEMQNAFSAIQSQLFDDGEGASQPVDHVLLMQRRTARIVGSQCNSFNSTSVDASKKHATGIESSRKCGANASSSNSRRLKQAVRTQFNTEE